MRKAAVVLFVVAVAVVGVLGLVKTGFFQKMVWVFQGTSLGEARPSLQEGGSPPADAPRGGGPVGPGVGSMRQGPPGGNWNGPAEGGRGAPPRGERRGEQTGGPGRGGQPTSGVSLARAGWFAAILAFFATITVLLDRGIRLLVARRKR